MLIIECQLTGHPPPKVTWFKDDRKMHKSSRFHQTLSEDGICESYKTEENIIFFWFNNRKIRGLVV